MWLWADVVTLPKFLIWGCGQVVRHSTGMMQENCLHLTLFAIGCLRTFQIAVSSWRGSWIRWSRAAPEVFFQPMVQPVWGPKPRESYYGSVLKHIHQNGTFLAMSDSVTECHNVTVTLPSFTRHLGSIPTPDVLSSICLTCASASKHATGCILNISISFHCGRSAQVLEMLFIKNSWQKQGLRISSRVFGKTSWLFGTEWETCYEKTGSPRAVLNKIY